MDFSKILAYQEVDKELRKHEKEMENSEDYKKAVSARSAFQNARVAAQQSGDDAEKLAARYAEIKAFFAEVSERVDELSKIADGKIELDELYEAEKELSDILEQLEREDSDLANLYKLIDEVVNKYQESYKNAIRYKKIYQDSSENYSKLKESKTDVIAELKAKLDGMEKDLEPELFKKYAHLRREKIVPGLVPLLDNSRCGFCRMEQSKSRLAALTFDNVIECESCRRMIYKEQVKGKK